MNDNNKNTRNKVVKSDEQAQSVEKHFYLNVKGSSKNTVFEE